jgi:hypothetical protein
VTDDGDPVRSEAPISEHLLGFPEVLRIADYVRQGDLQARPALWLTTVIGAPPYPSECPRLTADVDR